MNEQFLNIQRKKQLIENSISQLVQSKEYQLQYKQPNFRALYQQTIAKIEKQIQLINSDILELSLAIRELQIQNDQRIHIDTPEQQTLWKKYLDPSKNSRAPGRDICRTGKLPSWHKMLCSPDC